MNIIYCHLNNITLSCFVQWQITDLPPGRIPIKTYIIEGNEKGYENVYKVIVLLLQTFLPSFSGD